MADEEIRSTLTRLHETLGHTDAVDADLRTLLEQVDDDIHQLLDAEDRDASDAHGLKARIEEVGAQFAARHPHTERFFQELVAALGRMGI